MSTTKFKTLVITLVLVIPMMASAVKPYSVWMADSEMKRFPESWMIDFSKKLKWDYCNGLELQAIYQVWKKTAEPRYFNYVKSYADTIIHEDGSITG